MVTFFESFFAAFVIVGLFGVLFVFLLSAVFYSRNYDWYTQHPKQAFDLFLPALQLLAIVLLVSGLWYLL